MAHGMEKLSLLGKTTGDFDWHIAFCNFDEAWAKGPENRSEGAGIIIIHPDTGYTDHPTIKSARYLTMPPLSMGYVEKNAPSARDDLSGLHPSHGTSTASVIMSDKFGVAPEVKVIPYRVSTRVILWTSGVMALVRAIRYATSLNDAQGKTSIGVISISLGYYPLGAETSEIQEVHNKLAEVINVARLSGIVVCAAAGQLPEIEPPELFGIPLPVPGWLKPTPLFQVARPARMKYVIGVAGCQPDETYTQMPTGFWGEGVDVTAPATNIWVARTEPGESYINTQSWGTSYATAMVAGACAIWQAHHGRSELIHKYEIHNIFNVFKYVLKKSSYRPSDSNEWTENNRGFGVLDVKTLLEAPLPTKEDPEYLNIGT